MVKTIADVLRKKGNSVVSVSPDVEVFKALKLMASKDIGAVLVLEKGKVLGILSERDYSRKIILEGRSSLDTPVQKIMETRVYSITPEMTVEEGLGLMTENRTRHLPVIVDGQLNGLVSIGDLVYAIISKQGFIIGQLENYILND
ncbi:MAG: CBS domain-containing protein [Desulfuromonadales bacterium]|nr:CBS domain-containing protein [Desulfuromonadales bacterium]